MRALYVSSEVAPLTKTGGLADVAAALPAAMAALDVDVRLMMPAYPRALDMARCHRRIAVLPDHFGVGPVSLIEARTPDRDLPVILVDCPTLYDRPGGPYLDEGGREWTDNDLRFAVLSRAAAAVACENAVPGWRPDVVHANDWHTGLVPVYMAGLGGSRPRVVFTIHNMAFQGLFPADAVDRLRLPREFFTPDGFEFYGSVSFLKAGVRFADGLTTVSPTYAREILDAPHGCGMEGLLRWRRESLRGILNGIDERAWNPARDQHLPARYTALDMAGKHVCKLSVQHELGLEEAIGTPLVAFISRLTGQKMADVVLDAVEPLVAAGAQFALIAEGDRALEAGFRALAQRHPGRVGVRIGYEEPIAHRLYAGADIMLAPARFEPCGLTPLYAMNYGTLPVVRRVGGLADIVVPAAADPATADPAANGFAFDGETLDDMLHCLRLALSAYADAPRWQRLQQAAMRRRKGWQAAARDYLRAYGGGAAGVDAPAVDAPAADVPPSEPPAPRVELPVPPRHRRHPVREADTRGVAA